MLAGSSEEPPGSQRRKTWPPEAHGGAAAEPRPRSTHHGFWLNVSRIEALSDGIFAISMTLLVLTLNVPEVSQRSLEDLWQVLSDDWPRFEDYALSFFLLANFWLIHHRQFHFIKRIDERFLWLNILVLMLVALVPFSTELMSSYGDDQTSALIFEGNLLAIGLVYFGMWYYATRGYRLVDRDELSHVNITYSRAYNLVLPVISLAAMALSFASPANSEIVYLLVPVVIALMHRFEPAKPPERPENPSPRSSV